MAEAFDWERKAIGAAVSVFLVISAICLFIAGSLADRFPLCLILSSGLAPSAARIGALGFVTAPWQVIALYGMVFGIGAGLASPPPVGVMLTRRFPNRTGFANAAAITGMGPGQLVIIAGLSLVLADAGWRAVFIWLGIANHHWYRLSFGPCRNAPTPLWRARRCFPPLDHSGHLTDAIFLTFNQCLSHLRI